MERSSSYTESSSESKSNTVTDLRCYSASYASSYAPPPMDAKVKRAKSTTWRSSSSCSKAKAWSLSDPEVQRKRRVAGYKVYAMEGKVKGSLRRSMSWLKGKCAQVVHGNGW